MSDEMDYKYKELGDGIWDIIDGRLGRDECFCGEVGISAVGDVWYCVDCLGHGLRYGEIIETEDGYVEGD